MSDAGDRAAIEQATLGEAMAVTAAEGVVASARMADLMEAQRAARARHSAAKGLLTKAVKDGSAGKIATAQAREAAAYDPLAVLRADLAIRDVASSVALATNS